jgi:hypothetical protein
MSLPSRMPIWIRPTAANNGAQETVSIAKPKLDIIADALTMSREAFQQRLEKFLEQNGFDLEGGE